MMTAPARKTKSSVEMVPAYLYPKDRENLEKLAAYLQRSNAEAFREALRVAVKFYKLSR